MGAGVATGVAPEKSGSKGYQYIVVVGAFGAAFFGEFETHRLIATNTKVSSTYPGERATMSEIIDSDLSATLFINCRLGNWLK